MALGEPVLCVRRLAGGNGLWLCRKAAEVQLHVSNSDVGPPFLAALFPAHAIYSRCVVGVLGLVALIYGCRNKSQILWVIVQPVAVNVVNLKVRVWQCAVVHRIDDPMGVNRPAGIHTNPPIASVVGAGFFAAQSRRRPLTGPLAREVMRRAVVAPDQPAIIQAEALVQVCQRRQLFCF